MQHLIPSRFRRDIVKVDLIGCGGTGSHLLTELADLHLALLQLGHPHGLFVTVFDPDRVTESNPARSRFHPSDVGLYKAPLLVHRVNCSYGLDWAAFPTEYEYADRVGRPPDLVITAVDTLHARRDLYRQLLMSPFEPPAYWLDLGNGEDTGQVVLGEVDWLGDPYRYERQRRRRLRHIADLFPEMLEADAEEDEIPSCTLAGALGRQGLFINRHMAVWGGEILWQLFRHGGLDWHGVFLNARTGRVNALPVEGGARPLADYAMRNAPSALPGDPGLGRRRRRLHCRDARPMSAIADRAGGRR